VRRLLRSIPDWEQMLGGTELDPVRDLDMLLLAASQPFGTHDQPPDWFVIAKGVAGSDAALRAAIEDMVDQSRPRAPSPLANSWRDAGAVGEQQFGASRRRTDRGDAGRQVWATGPGGLQTVTIERYFARRSFVLLGDGMAAIAMPGQVERLAATLGRRTIAPDVPDDRSLVLLLQVEGARNLMTIGTWRGPFPMPRRMATGFYQTLDASGRADGSATLRSSLEYDSPEAAEHAREMFEYARGRWHVMLQAQLGPRGGLGRLLVGAVAGMAGIDLDAVETAIDAIEFRAEGDRVVVVGTLNAAQVRAVLNAATVGAVDQ
jgi:hypothetical protein